MPLDGSKLFDLGGEALKKKRRKET